MREFEVQIIETLSTIVKVEAECKDAALAKVKEKYWAEEVVLDASDFDYTNMEVINDSGNYSTNE